MVRKKRRNRRKSDLAAAGQRGGNLPSTELQAKGAAGLSSDPKMLICLLVGGVALVVYLAVFYSTPLSLPGMKDPIARGDLELGLFMSLPDLLDTWRGGGQSEVGLLDRVPLLLMTTALTAFAWVCGWLLLDLVGARRGLSRVESFVFSCAVGMCGISLITLVVGLCGGLRSKLAFALPALVVIGLADYRWWKQRSAVKKEKGKTDDATPADRQSENEDRRTDRWLRGGWLLLAAPFVVVILLGAMLPPSDFDVREYHLQVPKEWYQAGRIGFLPHNVYGNMPLGPQIMGIPAMSFFSGDLDWWWGSLVGKTLLGLYAPLTCLALFAAGRRFFSPAAGAVAALVYISIPWVAKVSMAGLVDGVWAFYVFAACYAGLIAVPVPSIAAKKAKTGMSWPHVILAGLLAGAAVTCKYPSLVFVVLPLTVWVWFAPPGRNWKAAAVLLLAAAVSCGPWSAKNWVLSGNPLYPLAAGVLGGETRTDDKIAQWERAHQIPRDEKGRSWHVSQLANGVARVGWASPWLSPLLVPLVVPAFFVARHRRTVLWLAAFAFWIFAVWWFASHRIDRFLIPMFPLLALIAGVGATWSAARWWRHVLLAVLFWGLVGNWLLVSWGVVMRVDSRFLVQLDQLRDDPDRVNPVHRHLNRTVPDGGRVLLVGDAQVFDLEVPVIYNTCFDDCQFERLMKGHSRQERIEALASNDISYIYVHWGELARYRSPGNYGYSDYVTPEVIGELIEQGILGPPVGDFDEWRGQLLPVLEAGS